MSVMYRIKPIGKYVHKCNRGCGVYIKARRMPCYGCITDILSGRPAGTWRKEKKKTIAKHVSALTITEVSLGMC